MTTGRVAIITGSSGGIGRAIALRLARENITVAVASRTDDRYPGTNEQTVELIREQGGEAFAFECDLSIRDDRLGLVQRVTDQLGDVDILVNNAAVSTMNDLADFPERRFTLMFDVQVRAPFELSQQVLPAMKRNGRGWIINVSSPAAFHPVAGAPAPENPGRTTVYGMCKIALERFSTGLAAEVYDQGINVNALAPTDVVPTFGANAFFDLSGMQAEPPEAMAEATAVLVDPTRDRVTGGILYSQSVLDNAGIPVPRLEK